MVQALGQPVEGSVNLITHARVAGGLCAFVFVIGLITYFAGTKGAHLSDIQLGTDPQHVQQLVRDSTIRTAAHRAIAIDYFFLTAYCAAFVALAALLARRGGLWLIVGIVAVGTATATATLDIFENVRTTDVLALYQPSSQLARTQLDALRHVSLIKWGASATTVTLLAGLFARRNKTPVMALALLVVAGIGYAGISRHGLIQIYLIALGVLTIIIALLLFKAPPDG
jgi:hypothetical protein